MREKKDQLVITFSTTTQAMKMEKFCLTSGIAGRLIPVPQEISAGCGLAWKAEPDMEETMKLTLQTAGIIWEEMKVLRL